MDEERRRAKMAAVNMAITMLESMSEGLTLGLGTGSTAEMFVKKLAESPARRKVIAVIPTSHQSELAAIRAGFTCISPLSKRPDVYVDSFDQADEEGNVIKGGGAALAREKVMMSVAGEVLLVGEVHKLVSRLNRAIPVEALPFAVNAVIEILAERGWRPAIRDAVKKAGPVITDNGNILLDVDIGEVIDAASVEREIKLISGVVEVGLCPRRRHRVLIGTPNGGVLNIG